MKTIEGNKLIAEFMGWKYHPETANHGMRDNTWEYKPHCYYHKLLFHSSWDWLMPVVEKIETTEYMLHHPKRGSMMSTVWIDTPYSNHPDFPIGWESNICSVSMGDLYRSERGEGAFSSKLEATWRAVVEFIQWYNQQNKQS